VQASSVQASICRTAAPRTSANTQLALAIFATRILAAARRHAQQLRTAPLTRTGAKYAL
jgi:hypothetical protein